MHASRPRWRVGWERCHCAKAAFDPSPLPSFRFLGRQKRTTKMGDSRLFLFFCVKKPENHRRNVSKGQTYVVLRGRWGRETRIGTGWTQTSLPHKALGKRLVVPHVGTVPRAPVYCWDSHGRTEQAPLGGGKRRGEPVRCRLNFGFDGLNLGSPSCFFLLSHRGFLWCQLGRSACGSFPLRSGLRHCATAEHHKKKGRVPHGWLPLVRWVGRDALLSDKNGSHRRVCTRPVERDRRSRSLVRRSCCLSTRGDGAGAGPETRRSKTRETNLVPLRGPFGDQKSGSTTPSWCDTPNQKSTTGDPM
mmetsp:Transcript_40499/g.105027  ORF Transcript_40499/g.105027 Transcript_40499/m.105027 type:complete len:303 (+) Transcript_40499:174-1082(+)